MVKSYLRYKPAIDGCFGVVTSAGTGSSAFASIAFDPSGQLALAPALEAVAIWHIRNGTMVGKLHEESVVGVVTVLAISPDQRQVAAGYSDGKIRLWDLSNNQCLVALSGHASAVSCLSYNSTGSLLVSGSNDTHIIVWDVVAERGLFRLKGHKGAVTHVKLLEKSNGLISSSKDTFLKVWDLETQHCVQTVVGHRSEVWSFDINADETRLYTASTDQQLRVWKLQPNPSAAPAAAPAPAVAASIESKKRKRESAADGNEEDEDHNVHGVSGTSGLPSVLSAAESAIPQVTFYGFVPRSSTDRIFQVRLSPQGGTLGIASHEKTVELFNVHTSQEISTRRRKRLARHRRKLEKRAENPDKYTDELPDEPQEAAVDELSHQQSVRASSNVRAFAYSPPTSSKPQLLFALADNKIEVVDLGASESKRSADIVLPGHPSDVRSVAISHDDTLLLTTSQRCAKVWNVHTHACIRTLESGYGLCSAFAPGNKFALLGTKEGNIEIHELATGDLIETIDAHSDAVWSLAVHPNHKGLVTGSADKTLKVWNFQLVSDPRNAARRVLSLSLVDTISMADDVLCVCFSQDQKFIAVSLLDNTVKVYYADTMKFFLSLYGHKLPVMSIDISSDSTLIATASADKNVKLWGLDFGDCHRSIFAHDDSVMQVKFVPNTHYFFTSSKDRLIKYWDGDTFEQIHKLSGHDGEIWAMAISGYGDFLVTASNDRSIRIWERSEEQVFLEEEQENDLDAMFESTLEKATQLGPGDADTESASASRRNLESIKAGERIIEALELVEKAHQQDLEYAEALRVMKQRMKPSEVAAIDKSANGWAKRLPPPVRDPMLLGKTPDRYLIDTIRSVQAQELEQALLLLNFSTATTFIAFLDKWIEQGKYLELCCRCLFSLLKTHNGQIVSNQAMVETLSKLQTSVRAQLQKQKDIMGFNRAALKYLQREIDRSQESKTFFQVSEQLAKLREAKGKKLPKKKRQKLTHTDAE